MIEYIIRRLALLPVILFGVTLLVFGMLSFLSPAERAALYVRDIPKNPNAMQGVIKRYGLDQPIYVQYWQWLVGRQDPNTGQTTGGILRGELGYSRSGSQMVSTLITRRFPATVELALFSFFPIIGIGTYLGVVTAMNHNKPVDQVGRIFSIIGYSFPSFVFGLLVLMFFYVQLGWFPPGRVSDWANNVILGAQWRDYTSLVTIDALLNGRVDIFRDALRHMILPILTLSYINWALFLRVARSSMLETLRQEYVTTARAKGLREREVINRHAMRNALIPVTTMAGLTVANLLGGVVITETIFEYPGIGSAAANAAANLDVITILSFTLLSGFILVVANLLVDIIYAFLDPRVRFA